ncbi:MAG: RNA polymerase sigma factor, partial [Calditrichia bacterium]
MLKIKFFRDREILERIRQNDRSVLGELFAGYRRMVFGYITSNGGSRSDAEDMLQEAIIVLWQNVSSGNFELTAKLSTYIMGIVKNKWMAEMRKRRRFPDGNFTGDVVGDDPSALQGLIDEEKTRSIREALNELSPVCKELLLLFYFEERNFDDIARIMNFANANVVKAKKYQCKKSLEKVLETSLNSAGR